MYIIESKVKSDNKEYVYLRAMQSVRVGTKVKKKVIQNLGRIDDPTSLAYLFYNKAETVSVSNNKLFKLPHAIYSICASFNILSIISTFMNKEVNIPVGLYTILMIIGRILDPAIELSRIKGMTFPSLCQIQSLCMICTKNLHILTKGKILLRRNSLMP